MIINNFEQKNKNNMHSSSLSPENKKSDNKKAPDTSLPPINTSQTLKYKNNYQSYVKQPVDNKQNYKDKSSSSLSSLISRQSSLSSSNISSVDNQQQSSSIDPTSRLAPSQDSPYQQKSQHKHPQMQNQERPEYRNKKVEEIQDEIKEMRTQFKQMNKKLSFMLDTYNMAKTDFVSKQLLTPSNSEFYQVQIQTNKKTEQAQQTELKKLKQTQLLVQNKDVLFDLENVLIQMREQLHQAKKERHDSWLKNHKQDVILDELIKINDDNKDTNAVKLLQLQIIYYLKKISSLKLHEEQLEHEVKLITENDKNLDLYLERIKKTNKFYYLVDQKYLKRKQNYETLMEKKKNLKKQIDAIKRSNQIGEEKLTRDMLQMNNQHNTIIKPSMMKYQQENYELQGKINRLMDAYKLNDNSLKDISYRFSDDLVYKGKNTNKQLIRNLLKPNFTPKSKLSNQSGYMSARGKQPRNNNSNQKLKTHRYNDKNASVTIDANMQEMRQRSTSEVISNLKPRNFRVISRNDKQPPSRLDKNHSYSTTIDQSSNYVTSIDTVIDVQKPKLLKPKLLSGAIAKN